MQSGENVLSPDHMQHNWAYILSMIASTTTLWTAALPQTAMAQSAQPVPPLVQSALPEPATSPPSPPGAMNAIRFRQTPTGLCPAELTDRINYIVNNPAFKSARWGILVASAASDTPLYSLNANEWLIPASNTKLLTSAAALQNYSFETIESYTRLKSWLTEVSMYSDNGYADALLKKIGGPTAVQQSLLKLGIDPASFQQVDGSGLSRSNRVKVSTLVSLLKAMQYSDSTGLFYDSLPVAGVSGTLRHRFHNTNVAGRLHAKTGTLNGVRALSGYLDTQDYGPLVVSVIVNQPGQSGSVLINAIDRIMIEVARITSCY